MMLPICIGPLRYAKRFILVGDNYQLLPLVHSHEARNAGLDQSLFQILCSAHPSEVIDLTTQYWMNEDIMSLSNELVYARQLKCATTAIARQSLTLPNEDYVCQIRHKRVSVCWLRDVLTPQ